MSKITLEPNESGAGTFSIVSPDSNTNRTLTLPDEAGTILSNASTIDSNNLQSDVYKQNNILGTVSESGGAPTGAIIERGSNANGEFVKYADGTMIQVTKDYDPGAIDGSTNSGVFRGVPSSGDWPVSFATILHAHGYVSVAVDRGGQGVWVGFDERGTEPYDNNGFFSTNVYGASSAPSGYRFRMFAIGRWY